MSRSDPSHLEGAGGCEAFEGLAGPEGGLAAVRTLARRVVADVDRLLDAGGVDQVSQDEVRDLLTAAVRLYAAKSEAEGTEFLPTRPGTAATDAVTVACALLRAQRLSPFELALWFHRPAQAGEEGRERNSREGGAL